MSIEVSAAALAAGAGGGSRPTRPDATLTLLAAAAALAAGVGLVGAGVAWAPSRDGAQAMSRGAQLYAAECASCHGARLEGWGMEVRARLAPPLGPAGHAWRHSNAELAAIVAQGTGSVTPPGVTPGMPGFAERLDRSDLDAILAYVKSGWPRSARTYQDALSQDGKGVLATLLRDPAWVFPAQCLSPPAAPPAR